MEEKKKNREKKKFKTWEKIFVFIVKYCLQQKCFYNITGVNANAR